MLKKLLGILLVEAGIKGAPKNDVVPKHRKRILEGIEIERMATELELDEEELRTAILRPGNEGAAMKIWQEDFSLRTRCANLWSLINAPETEPLVRKTALALLAKAIYMEPERFARKGQAYLATFLNDTRTTPENFVEKLEAQRNEFMNDIAKK